MKYLITILDMIALLLISGLIMMVGHGLGIGFSGMGFATVVVMYGGGFLRGRRMQKKEQEN